MRKNIIAIFLIAFFITTLIASCNRNNELPVAESPASEQMQNASQQTPTSDATTDYTPVQDITDISDYTSVQDNTDISDYTSVQDNTDITEGFTSNKRFSSMEEAYYSKYVELAEKYGTYILHDVKREDYDGYSYLGGVCIVNFMDFNGDGVQDLFVVYSNGQINRIVTNNSKRDVYDFPTKDTYEIEIWSYIGGELIQILHEPHVSVYDTSSYSYHNPDELIYLDYQFSITIFENGAGLPVVQIFNYEKRDNVWEYNNIYFSEGKTVRDRLTYKDSVFLINDSKTTWDIWIENVAGYDKILLSALIADSNYGLSTYLLEWYGIDYDNTMFQTGRVIEGLSYDRKVPEISNWLVSEGEYISLYLREVYRSNMLLCDWEDSEKYYFDHHYMLYDIDQNGIPELILYEGSSGAGTHFHFYTIIDGEIIYCGDYGRASLYSNGEGGLIANNARMGGYHIDKITLNGAAIETEFIASGEVLYDEEYPELDKFGYNNYKYLPFCPPTIPFTLYTYNQNLFPE